MKNRKLFAAILCFFTSSVLILYTLKDNEIIIATSETPVASQSSPYIFFVETSGSSSLNGRQACAIESTARHNANSKINVLMFSTLPIEDSFELNRTLPNISVLPGDFEAIFLNTPLEKWYREGSWKGDHNEILHLSDASRLALIWKFGGIYLDLDIVMLRSLNGLRNFLIKQNQEGFCNGIFGFDNKHPFLYNCMYNFDRRCIKQGGSFGCGGPELLTKVFKLLCSNSKVIKEGINCNIQVLPVVFAFPVPYSDWRNYFNASSADEVNTKMKRSYLIHLWNYLSFKEIVRLGSGSVYEKAAAMHCPLVYSKINGTF